jgi:predicted kinase
MALLIVFAGLPGSGKSAIARELALRVGAIWLRVDSISEAMLQSDVVVGDLKDAPYRAAYAVAHDNLRLGRDVIGDCVNDWKITRDAWQAVGLRAGVEVVWVEVICSDTDEHRRRIETRTNETPDLPLPDWQAVIGRDYHAWDRDRLVVDTATNSLAVSVDAVGAHLRSRL